MRGAFAPERTSKEDARPGTWKQLNTLAHRKLGGIARKPSSAESALTAGTRTGGDQEANLPSPADCRRSLRDEWGFHDESKDSKDATEDAAQVALPLTLPTGARPKNVANYVQQLTDCRALHPKEARETMQVLATTQL
ncbi:hypothetical protein WJX73_006858 [Symbiochloris irregularis]|uniref:Uncharacterized protein n=1 Tax=Symbiochloris irregularis TaxID=706552 RepID=A0AAW1P6Q1_9CHLO